METTLERIVQIGIRHTLEDLNNAFCYYLDHGDIDGLIDLFCKDAIYSHGTRVSRGREEIRQLFQNRNQAGTRTSRHLQTGLRTQRKGADKATGTSVCLTFAADAAPPITPASPYLVADFIDTYRRCADGRWRIEKRQIDRIFTSPENTAPVGANTAAANISKRTMP